MVGKSGFSLVELSIVLVILGLLVGGILGGQSLIRAAELRNITVEYQQFETALNTFRHKYNTLPGDFNKAIQFWGDADNPPANATGRETRNGDGNGVVSEQERWIYWQHLSNAGLIEGRYSGEPADMSAPAAGQDMPTSRMGSGAAWWIWFGRNASGQEVGNIWVLSSGGNWNPDMPVLSPEELWGVDNKMDDGQPLTGIVQSGHRSDQCIDETADPVSYQLSLSSAGCTASFPRNESGWSCSGWDSYNKGMPC